MPTEDNKCGNNPKGKRDLLNLMLRLKILKEWKTQITLLVAAPFAGVGFVFNFLLRAKDFPELASAMWGVFIFFVGVFFFIVFIVCAVFYASLIDASRKDTDASGSHKVFVKWIGVLVLAITFLALAGYSVLVLSISANGFGYFVSPYVHWLELHSR